VINKYSKKFTKFWKIKEKGNFLFSVQIKNLTEPISSQCACQQCRVSLQLVIIRESFEKILEIDQSVVVQQIILNRVL
jgi:hypothetical protein